MAEANTDMVTVFFGERKYNLIYVPSKDCPVVEEKAKYIENQLNLKQFGSEDILKLGELVQLAYFGVVGHTGLQSEVRPALNVLSDLCDEIIHTLNMVKRSLHGAVIRIQTVYEYLDNSYETNALQTLKELQPISQKLLHDSDSLTQMCFEKKNFFLKVRHNAEEKKQIVVDEAQKQKKKLSASRIEKFTCEILIKRSNKIISKETKQITSFKEQIIKINAEKAKCDDKCKDELDSASKKYKEKLGNLKSKHDSSNAKLIKDSKKRQKRCDSSAIDSKVKASADSSKIDGKVKASADSSAIDSRAKASAECIKSADQHNEVDDKLTEPKQCSPLGDENKEKPNEIISEDHHLIQSNYHKKINRNVPQDTDVVNANYAGIAGHDIGLSLNVSDTQLTAVEGEDRLQNTQTLQESTLHCNVPENDNVKAKDCEIMGAPKFRVESSEDVKVVSTKQVNDSKSLASNQENKSDSTAISKKPIKGNNKTYEEQQEALLQEYDKNKQGIEQKYKKETEKLDAKLEKLNKQLATSEKAIKDNEQKIKDIQQKIPELTKIIADKAKVDDYNSTSIECICHVIAALYTVGSIIKKLGNFLRDFTKLCNQLFNDETLPAQIDKLQNDIWKSNTFKIVILNYYGNCIAFTSMCNTAVEYITKAQEEVYQNVCKELSTDEAFQLVQKKAPVVLPQIELD